MDWMRMRMRKYRRSMNSMSPYSQSENISSEIDDDDKSVSGIFLKGIVLLLWCKETVPAGFSHFDSNFSHRQWEKIFGKDPTWKRSKWEKIQQFFGSNQFWFIKSVNRSSAPGWTYVEKYSRNVSSKSVF